MSDIEWDGSEYAITVVGNAITLPFGEKVFRVEGHSGVVTSTFGQGIVRLAVDAYKIEPDYKPGELIRNQYGIFLVREGHAGGPPTAQKILNAAGEGASTAYYLRDLQRPLERVKVVPA